MKFKVVEGSKAYKNLMAVKAREIAYLDELKKILKDVPGAKRHHVYEVGSENMISVEFVDGCPEGWKSYWKKHNLYIPKVGNDIAKQLYKLDIPDRHDYNKAVGFVMANPSEYEGRQITIDVGYIYRPKQNLWLINSGNGTVSVGGMVEILESEFTSLAKTK